MPRIIEAVPNISEGRRPDIVGEAVAALKRAPGVRVLDVQSDKDHNRSVLTLVGDAVGQRFGLPVFLYEEAAAASHRRNLEDVRRGQFEGLAAKMKDPLWAPDFGPRAPHPSAGAVAIGARMPLIAYNINLGTADVEIAKRIAKGIRHSGGGYRFVKAMGLLLEQRKVAQVSINMTDFKKTPLHRVFETVRAEAERHGVSVVGSEIVGLVPSEALLDAADHFLRLEGFSPSQVLERKIRETD